MLTPVLCLLLFKNLKPAQDNFLVRFIKTSYLKQLDHCLNHRWLTVAFFAVLSAARPAWCPAWAANSCRNWKRATCGSGTWPAEHQPAGGRGLRKAPAIMASFPEVADVVNQIGRTDDAPTPTATTIWSSSCPCGRKSNGRPSSRNGLAALLSAPSGRGPKTNWSPTWTPSCNTRSSASPGTSRKTSATT